MIFTIELLKSHHEGFRLQKDGTWRNLNFDFSLKDSDFITSNPAKVVSITPYGGNIEIGKQTYLVSPAAGRLGEVLNGDSMVFRKELPDIPKKEELRYVIATGDDTVNNVLILNLNGKFELRTDFDKSINDPTVVLRHETFCAYNDYIGEAAANDEDHINQVFGTCMQGWLSHLKTGRTQRYYDHESTQSIKSLLAEIETLKLEWIPQY